MSDEQTHRALVAVGLLFLAWVVLVLWIVAGMIDDLEYAQQLERDDE